ncbi:splicing factor Mud2p [Monosporozyma servazzii]
MSNNEKTLEELRMKILSSIGKSDDKKDQNLDKPVGTANIKRDSRSMGRGLPTHPLKRARPDYRNGDKQGRAPAAYPGAISRHESSLPNQYPTHPRRDADTMSRNSRYSNQHNNGNNGRYYDRNENRGQTNSRYSDNNGSNGYRARARANIEHSYTQNNHRNNNIPNHNPMNKRINAATHGPKDANYIAPAFRDKFRYNNATYSKLNCKLIINDPLEGKLDMLRSLLERFLVKQKGKLKSLLGHNLRNDKANPVEEELTTVEIENVDKKCILSFSSFQCLTLVLSCRTFFNRQLGLPSLNWSRPQSYIEFTDHINKLSNSNVIAIEEVSTPEEYTQEAFSAEFGSDQFNMYPIYSQEEDPSTEKFTNCVILTFNSGITKRVTDALDSHKLKWFCPNKSESKLRQKTARWLYSDITQVVQAKQLSSQLRDSNVLLLLNCVDPVDLKDSSFVTEIHDTLLGTLAGAQAVKIIEPGVDYRLNLAHLNDFVGTIFVQFKTSKHAEEAEEDICGTEFNGRSVLCARFNQNDFETMGLLPFEE